MIRFSLQLLGLCLLLRSGLALEPRREVPEGGEPPRSSGEPPRSSGESNSTACRQSMKVGPCRAAFPRFFYNVTSHSCSLFIYGGCDGNRNNFESVKACMDTCTGVTGPAPARHQPAVKSPRMAPGGPAESDPAETVPLQETGRAANDFTEHCEAEPKVGPCRAALKHWYYNKEAGSCQTFIYGGCSGNKNNYITKEECMATCTVTVLPSLKKTSDDDEVSADYRDRCTVTPDPGPCRAAFTMFYYDPNTATCQSFLYGGCRGNANRYGTMEECMSGCSGDGSFDSRGKPRNRWTAALFLFVTLAAISALLLATLIVITLRRHRLSRHPSSVSDKEELLPEPDEQSSVDSLPVPMSPEPPQKA